MLRKDLQQSGKPRRVVPDPFRVQHATLIVHNRNIMMIFSPIDATTHSRHLVSPIGCHHARVRG
jgi:hypothetical protein